MDQRSEINISARRLLSTIPDGVIVVAAAKTRTIEQVQAVVQAGITHIGHNYVQEAQDMVGQIHGPMTWHMIGHLQRNKVKSAAELFDVIETVDSLRLAEEIDKRCAALGKAMPVLIEINSGREPNKDGAWPEAALMLAQQIAALIHIRVQGVMTMGPLADDPEVMRPFFRTARTIFEQLRNLNLPNTEIKWLSMGMSDSYQVAIEEGANMVRIGTRLFGPRL